jgi:hypothetical protein
MSHRVVKFNGFQFTDGRSQGRSLAIDLLVCDDSEDLKDKKTERLESGQGEVTVVGPPDNQNAEAPLSNNKFAL